MTTAIDLSTLPKIPLKLVGLDGNAFAVMGAVKKAARRAGWSKEAVQALLDEMMSGDYNNLLATAMEYCDDPEDEDDGYECSWCGSNHCEGECMDDEE